VRRRFMASSRIGRSLTPIMLDAVLWGVGLSGCQLVFGEYRPGHGTAGKAAGTGEEAGAGGTERSGGTASTGGAADSSVGGKSSGGSISSDCSGNPPFRCLGPELQACASGQWTTIDTCTRAAFCQSDLGVCDVCATGDRICDGAVLSVCNDDQTAFEEKATCVAPLYCDVGADDCVACAAGQKRCNGDHLDVCSDERTAWESEAQSCYGLGCHVVDGTNDYCNDCTAADVPVCSSDTTLRSCVSGKWRAMACPTGCTAPTPTTPAACY
jgi:hypothetical protein